MDHTQAVTDVVTKFFTHLDPASEVTIAVVFDAATETYNINLTTNQPALIIGYHGESLSALQSLVGQHVHASVGEWLNLSVNVNDYRERRQTAIQALIDSAVSRVMATGLAHSLPPMPASERRLVHMLLADSSQVVTTSEGVGRSRTVIISPKTA